MKWYIEAARMTGVAAFCSFAIVALGVAACAASMTTVQLAPDQQTTVRVGQMVAVAVPTGYASPGFTQQSMRAVRHVRQDGRELYVYRAVAEGPETFVLTPLGRRDGQCVSCVTEHYFVTVLP